MSAVDLRPLSLGEILDRTFSLYRNNFLLFIGISAIPALLSFAAGMAALFLNPVRAAILSPDPANLGALLPSFGGVMMQLVTIVVYLIAYLFSQGGTILAVSDLYLGRPTTIAASLRGVWSEFGALFGVVILNGLVVGVSLLLLIIPGIYVACRLLVCVPAALIEHRGPRESLSRSFELTRGSAWRSFVVMLLTIVLSLTAGFIFSFPLGVLMGAYSRDPEMLRLVTAANLVASSIANVLVTPVLLIATSVYYYDLRVRKEAFDLQFMMDPTSQRVSRSGDIPSILS